MSNQEPTGSLEYLHLIKYYRTVSRILQYIYSPVTSINYQPYSSAELDLAAEVEKWVGAMPNNFDDVAKSRFQDLYQQALNILYLPAVSTGHESKKVSGFFRTDAGLSDRVFEPSTGMNTLELGMQCWTCIVSLYNSVHFGGLAAPEYEASKRLCEKLVAVGGMGREVERLRRVAVQLVNTLDVHKDIKGRLSLADFQMRSLWDTFGEVQEKGVIET
jgi:hypothetical protein